MGRWRIAVHGLLLAAALAGGAWLSWRRWPDLLVDFGHELYIPWRMVEGETLYRDLPFTMGPLSQHVHALLFRLFGVSLSTLIGANLVILALITGMLHWLLARCGSALSATVACLFFLAVFAFAQYGVIGNYNYVCPYRHEATHGLALGLAEMICLVRFAESRQWCWLAGGGLCLGLAALTKAEMVLPAVASAAAALAVGLRCGPPWGQPVRGASIARGALVFLLAATAPLILAIVFLLPQLGWPQAVDGAVGYWKYVFDPALTTRSGFYRALAGTDQPAASLATMILATAVLFAAAASALLLERLLVHRRWKRTWRAALAVAAALGGLRWVAPAQWQGVAAALPAVLAAVVVAEGLRLFRRSPTPVHAAALPAPGSIALFLFAVYSLALLPKIALQARWDHYGFVLGAPGTLVLVHLAVHALPEWLRRQRLSGGYGRAAALGLLAACAFTQVWSWNRIYGEKTQAVGQAGDRFYADPRHDERTVPTVNTLERLASIMRPGETLVVIPEGTTLNYLLRARNPSGYLMFSPWEFDAHGGEPTVRAALQRDPPDYLVLLTMDMTIHGRGNFGSPGFGASIQELIDARYEPIDTFAAPQAAGPPFQAEIWRRRPGQEGTGG